MALCLICMQVWRIAFCPFTEGALVTSGAGHVRFWMMARTFTGLKLQGQAGRFGALDASDTAGFAELPSRKVCRISSVNPPPPTPAPSLCKHQAYTVKSSSSTRNILCLRVPGASNGSCPCPPRSFNSRKRILGGTLLQDVPAKTQCKSCSVAGPAADRLLPVNVSFLHVQLMR